MKFESNTTYILDGAMGTELQRRGYETTLPLWSAKALFDIPEIVQDIHKEYILAGSDIITTNTFRTQRRTLAKAGLEKETERINKLAVELAVQAREDANANTAPNSPANPLVNQPVYIAGCLTTLEDCYRVDLVPDTATLEREHAEQAELLAATPIDFFLLETFNTIREAKAAARAAYATGKPFAISFVTNADNNLLSGETLEHAIMELDIFNPLAYLINCVPITTATSSLKLLRQLTQRPIGGYANGNGEAHDDQGWLFANDDKQLQQYSAACAGWKKSGVQIIGGCCGTNPEYTKAYSAIK